MPLPITTNPTVWEASLIAAALVGIVGPLKAINGFRNPKPSTVGVIWIIFLSMAAVFLLMVLFLPVIGPLVGWGPCADCRAD